MAAFDAVERKIVVRVVFDGPGCAGKTTNIRRLHSFFTSQRRSDLATPEEIDGRTQFFDWMHLDGGLVQGYQLRCQMLSVPGQRSLAARRWSLLRTADVVVFVCESTPSGLDEARPMFTEVREHMEARFPDETLPLVVQANKQDLANACDESTVRQSLELDVTVPLLGARAEAGMGVRETAVLAIRTAANRVQRLMIDRGLESLTTDPQTADELLAELRDVHPDTVCEEVAVGAPEPESPTVEVGDDAPPPDPWPVLPPLPDPGVPSGFIWPAATGREVLRSVHASEEELVRGSPPDDVRDALVLERGMWRLTTAPRFHYRDADEGRAALLQMARRKSALGALLAPRTALSLQPGEGTAHWLWSVAPGMTPLDAHIAHARRQNDTAELCEELRVYARALLEAAALSIRRELVLDLHPRSFARVGRDVYYVGNRLEPGRSVSGLARILLAPLATHATVGDAVETYVVTVLEVLGERLTAEELERVGLRAELTFLVPGSDAQWWAREQLLGFLRAVEPLALEGTA
ncbi:MAG: GTP-binding protein [Myxococcota bacterium]